MESDQDGDAILHGIIQHFPLMSQHLHKDLQVVRE